MKLKVARMENKSEWLATFSIFSWQFRGKEMVRRVDEWVSWNPGEKGNKNNFFLIIYEEKQKY